MQQKKFTNKHKCNRANTNKKTREKKKLTLKKLETWIWKKSKLQAPSPTPIQSKGEGMRGVANWRGAKPQTNNNNEIPKRLES